MGCYPRGQRQAAAIALRAAYSGIVNKRIHTRVMEQRSGHKKASLTHGVDWLQLRSGVITGFGCWVSVFQNGPWITLYDN